MPTPVGLITAAVAANRFQAKDASLTFLSGKSVQGSGDIVLATSPTIVTPTIASFANAAHNHQNAAGGATLDHGLALTGLSDDDHTQYLYNAPATTTRNLITQPSSANMRFLSVDPFDADAKLFNWNITTTDNVSGRKNVTLSHGYNNVSGGGPDDAADAAFYLQLESHFNPTGTDPLFEYHLNAFTAAGVGTRPFQINVYKDDLNTSIGLYTDVLSASSRVTPTFQAWYMDIGADAAASQWITYVKLDSRNDLGLILNNVALTRSINFSPPTQAIQFGGNADGVISTSNTTRALQLNNWASITGPGFTFYGGATLQFSLVSRLSIIRAANVVQLQAQGHTTQTSPVSLLITNDTLNTSVRPALRLQAQNSTASTGGGIGFGTSIEFYAESATDATYQQQARLRALWTTATDASRISNLVLSVFNVAAEVDVLTLSPTGLSALAIDSTPIGGTTPAAGTFNPLVHSGTSGTITQSGGNVLAFSRNGSNSITADGGSSANIGFTVNSVTPLKLATLGRAAIGTGTVDGQFFVQVTSSDHRGITVKAFGGQTAELFHVLNSSDVVLASISAAGALTVLSDTDATTILGRARIASPTSDVMYLSHYDFSTTSNYALYHNSSGQLSLNTAAGQDMVLQQNNTAVARVNANGVGIGITPAFALHVVKSDVGTGAVTDVAVLSHNSTGTPGVSFGTGLRFQGESSTTDNRDMARLRALWTTATDATRVANFVFSVWNITTEVSALTLAPTATTIANTVNNFILGDDSGFARIFSAAAIRIQSNVTSGVLTEIRNASGDSAIAKTLLQISSGTAPITTAGSFILRVFNDATGGTSAFLEIDKDGLVVFNQGGLSTADLRMEGDTDANLFFLDASADMVGFKTNAPTAVVDINSDIIRLRTAKTPASAAAAGNQGDICWDSGFLYVCIANATWVKTALATW